MIHYLNRYWICVSTNTSRRSIFTTHEGDLCRKDIKMVNEDVYYIYVIIDSIIIHVHVHLSSILSTLKMNNN